MQLQLTSGDPKVVLASVKPLEFHDQTCAIITFADITEQKQAEEHFAQMFRLSPVPSCLIALGSKKVVNANRSFLDVTGYHDAEVLNRTSYQLGLWPSEQDCRKIDTHLAGKKGFGNLGLRLRTKSGELRDVIASAEVLDDAELLLLMFHDVTQSRRTEDQLLQAIQEVMSDATSFAHLIIKRFANLKAETQDSVQLTTAGLTARELQVLQGIAKGLSNDAIAAELRVAPQTIRNYVSSIYDKLGFHTRAEAVVWAHERKLEPHATSAIPTSEWVSVRWPKRRSRGRLTGFTHRPSPECAVSRSGSKDPSASAAPAARPGFAPNPAAVTPTTRRFSQRARPSSE